jgi:peptidoglycan/LPS O-acetylase OafA/YrhL
LLSWRVYLQNFLLFGLNQTGFWGSYYRMNNLAWTLDVELQYYLLTPLLVLTVLRFRSVVIGVLLIPAVASVYLVFHPTGLIDIDRSLIAWSAFFFTGFVFYASTNLQRLAERVSIVTAAATACFVIAAVINRRLPTDIFVVLGFLSISAYLLVAQSQCRFGAWDKLAGDLSYPLYILNIIVVGFAAKYLAEPVARSLTLPSAFAVGLIMNLLVATIVAYLALRLIAAPIEVLRRMFKTSGGHAHLPEVVALKAVGVSGA